MSMIKKFFEKKKTDAKFKLAGKGQKLCDPQAPTPGPSVQPRPGPSGAQRGLTNEQRLAAEAALSRVNKTTIDQEDFEKKRSRAAIRAQAMKEMQREKEAEDEARKLKEKYGNPKEVEIEGPSFLSCKGVFYKCPMIGPEVLPKEAMRLKIKEFLFEQLNDEKGLAAALMIHTLNKDQEKVKVCVDTLSKYLENIILSPTEEKYHKIRKSNKAYQDRVAGLEGSEYFLEAAGFGRHIVEGEDFWVFPIEKLSNPDTLETLQTLKDALQSAEPVQAMLDRGLRVLLPNQVQRDINLPLDFYNITADELKREQQSKSEAVERESMLRTKAMREKEEQREKRKYRFSIIRVRFPDGLVLQGTFSVYEKFQDVMDFVTENLLHQLPFVLYVAGTGSRLGDLEAESTLLDLGLIPSTLLTFAWHPEMAEEIQAGIGSSDLYLREDIAALAETN